MIIWLVQWIGDGRCGVVLYWTCILGNLEYGKRLRINAFLHTLPSSAYKFHHIYITLPHYINTISRLLFSSHLHPPTTNTPRHPRTRVLLDYRNNHITHSSKQPTKITRPLNMFRLRLALHTHIHTRIISFYPRSHCIRWPGPGLAVSFLRYSSTVFYLRRRGRARFGIGIGIGVNGFCARSRSRSCTGTGFSAGDGFWFRSLCLCLCLRV